MNLELFDLTGKVAIVTGGNGGLGLGMAMGLASAGAHIVVASRNQEKTQQAVHQIEALGVKALGVYLDVLQPELVEACIETTVETFGGFDILVANSGTVVRKPPEELSIEEWDLVIDTNLKGTFLCCKAAFPHLVKRGGGKIITNGSMFSIFGSTVRSAYPVEQGGHRPAHQKPGGRLGQIQHPGQLYRTGLAQDGADQASIRTPRNGPDHSAAHPCRSLGEPR